MPFIQSNISMKLSENQKEKIKEKLGKIISLFPGKSEQWLMVGIQDEFDLYYRGDKKEKAAYIEVKIFGKGSRENKDAVTAKICSVLQSELGISPSDVYITFYDISEWGWNGGLL